MGASLRVVGSLIIGNGNRVRLEGCRASIFVSCCTTGGDGSGGDGVGSRVVVVLGSTTGSVLVSSEGSKRVDFVVRPPPRPNGPVRVVLGGRPGRRPVFVGCSGVLSSLGIVSVVSFFFLIVFGMVFDIYNK